MLCDDALPPTHCELDPQKGSQMRRERLAGLATRQFGLFTRAQALALGLSAKEIDYGARVGRWVRVYRGVHLMAGAPASKQQSLLAAVLACGPGAVASHRGAAWVWGLADDVVLEVTGRLQRAPAADVVVHRRAAGDIRPTVRRRIPCTDPLRTVVDLAAVASRASVESAIDRGVASGLFPVRAVGAELERRAAMGRAGTRVLRACLTERLDGGGGRTSCLESPMDRLIVRQGLPVPARQYWVAGTRYRLDYAWPAARLAVEVDGYKDHSGVDAFRQDRERQNVLVLLGWTVLRFTWADVQRYPARVAGLIRRALAGGAQADALA